MLIRIVAVALFGLALGAAGCLGASDVKPREPRSTNLPRPLDYAIAVQGELDAARRAGTLEAYDLFLARQGDHPLAEVARKERRILLDARGR